METIYEVIRIKQEIKDVQKKLEKYVSCPSDVNKVASYYIGEEDREVFLVICLNIKKNIIAIHRSHIGTLNNAPVSPREVFKACILNNAKSIVIAHNHPSTNVMPSEEDFEVTKVIQQAGNFLDIPLLDSLIVNGKGEYFSFKQEGYLLEDRVVKRRRKQKN